MDSQSSPTFVNSTPLRLPTSPGQAKETPILSSGASSQTRLGKTRPSVYLSCRQMSMPTQPKPQTSQTGLGRPQASQPLFGYGPVEFFQPATTTFHRTPYEKQLEEENKELNERLFNEYTDHVKTRSQLRQVQSDLQKALSQQPNPLETQLLAIQKDLDALKLQHSETTKNLDERIQNLEEAQKSETSLDSIHESSAPETVSSLDKEHKILMDFQSFLEYKETKLDDLSEHFDTLDMDKPLVEQDLVYFKATAEQLRLEFSNVKSKLQSVPESKLRRTVEKNADELIADCEGLLKDVEELGAWEVLQESEKSLEEAPDSESEIKKKELGGQVKRLQERQDSEVTLDFEVEANKDMKRKMDSDVDKNFEASRRLSNFEAFQIQDLMRRLQSESNRLQKAQRSDSTVKRELERQIVNLLSSSIVADRTSDKVTNFIEEDSEKRIQKLQDSENDAKNTLVDQIRALQKKPKSEAEAKKIPKKKRLQKALDSESGQMKIPKLKDSENALQRRPITVEAEKNRVERDVTRPSETIRMLPVFF